MDPLSISASVVALFTITAQLISAVETITDSVKTQPAVLRSVIQELTALHLILDKLKSLSNLLVLDGCMETYESIGEEMKEIQSSLDRGSIRKLFTQMSFLSKLKKLDPLRDQLEKFKATLSLALHVRNM
jgi:Fungal N-terminal domain of STAND proteins